MRTADGRVRVLHVVLNLHFGGMERIVAEIVRRTDPARFETHVLAINYVGHFGEGLDAVAPVHVAPRMSRLSMLRPASLAATIHAIAPAIVHSHSGAWFKAARAARIAGVPYVIHTDHGRQNPDPWSYRFVEGLASRRTDAVIAVSDMLARQMAEIVADPRRIRVIANGVDTERYMPGPPTGALHTLIGIAPATPVIASVGRLVTVKAYDVLIAAFARLALPATTLAPHLVLVGEGSEETALRAQARTLGVADRVHFPGMRDNVDLLLRDAAIFTMSSHSEGTSVSLLEAMSSGRCPVVTNVGGNPAVLGPALAHRLVPPANPDALATALADALIDTTRRDADARLARDRVVAAFGMDSMVDAYAALYTSLAATGALPT